MFRLHSRSENDTICLLRALFFGAVELLLVFAVPRAIFIVYPINEFFKAFSMDTGGISRFDINSSFSFRLMFTE